MSFGMKKKSLKISISVSNNRYLMAVKQLFNCQMTDLRVFLPCEEIS